MNDEMKPGWDDDGPIVVANVEVPPELWPIVGAAEPGTRVHRASGSEDDIEKWFDTINKHFGSMVSPGGVSMFAPVSRAGVHARIKRGQLTCFLFHPERETKSLILRKSKIERERVPYAYIPVCECKAWGKVLRARAEELQNRCKDVTAETATPELVKAVKDYEHESGGEKRDWNDDFMNWPRRSETVLRGRPRKEIRD